MDYGEHQDTDYEEDLIEEDLPTTSGDDSTSFTTKRRKRKESIQAGNEVKPLFQSMITGEYLDDDNQQQTEDCQIPWYIVFTSGLLDNIAAFLPSAEEILRLRLVCSFFRKVLDTNAAWKNICRKNGFSIEGIDHTTNLTEKEAQNLFHKTLSDLFELKHGFLWFRMQQCRRYLEERLKTSALAGYTRIPIFCDVKGNPIKLVFVHKSSLSTTERNLTTSVNDTNQTNQTSSFVHSSSTSSSSSYSLPEKRQFYTKLVPLRFKFQLEKILFEERDMIVTCSFICNNNNSLSYKDSHLGTEGKNNILCGVVGSTSTFKESNFTGESCNNNDDGAKQEHIDYHGRISLFTKWLVSNLHRLDSLRTRLVKRSVLPTFHGSSTTAIPVQEIVHTGNHHTTQPHQNGDTEPTLRSTGKHEEDILNEFLRVQTSGNALSKDTDHDVKDKCCKSCGFEAHHCSTRNTNFQNRNTGYITRRNRNLYQNWEYTDDATVNDQVYKEKAESNVNETKYDPNEETDDDTDFHRKQRFLHEDRIRSLFISVGFMITLNTDKVSSDSDHQDKIRKKKPYYSSKIPLSALFDLYSFRYVLPRFSVPLASRKSREEQENRFWGDENSLNRITGSSDSLEHPLVSLYWAKFGSYDYHSIDHDSFKKAHDRMNPFNTSKMEYRVTISDRMQTRLRIRILEDKYGHDIVRSHFPVLQNQVIPMVFRSSLTSVCMIPTTASQEDELYADDDDDESGTLSLQDSEGFPLYSVGDDYETTKDDANENSLRFLYQYFLYGSKFICSLLKRSTSTARIQASQEWQNTQKQRKNQ